jgi:hypothetical protein
MIHDAPLRVAHDVPRSLARAALGGTNALPISRPEIKATTALLKIFIVSPALP